MAMDSPYSEAQFQKAPKVNMFLSLPKKKKKNRDKGIPFSCLYLLKFN